MWILSQNKKELVNTQGLSVIKSGDIATDLDNDGCYTTLGNYGSEERAIQVLDLAKNNIADFKYADMCQDKENAPKYIVFEMPEV